jgi:hypothetical protein
MLSKLHKQDKLMSLQSLKKEMGYTMKYCRKYSAVIVKIQYQTLETAFLPLMNCKW